MEIDKIMQQSVSADPQSTDISMYVDPTQVSPYKLVDDAYYGEGGFRNGTYITPNIREQFYKSRISISTFKNYTKPILNALIDPIFKKAIPRTAELTSLWAGFLKNCDCSGTNLDNFIHDTLNQSIRHGLAFVVMDNYSVIPESKQDALLSRTYPYVMHKTIMEVSDYKLDDWGNLVSIVFIDKQVKDASSGNMVQTYRYWDNTVTRLVTKSKDNSYVTLNEVQHNLGVIPVLVLYSSTRRDLTKLEVSPPFYDLVKLNLALYNKESEIRDLERAQAFSILCVQTDRGGNLTIGSHNVLFVSPEVQFMPSYISPDPTILAGLVSGGEKLRDDLFRLAEQSGVTGVQNQASGISQSYSFFGQETVLQKNSQLCSTLDTAIFNLFGLYTKESVDYTVDYPDSFSPSNATADVTNLTTYIGLNPPPKARNLAMEKMTKILLGDQDEAALDAAIKEINEQGGSDVQ